MRSHRNGLCGRLAVECGIIKRLKNSECADRLIKVAMGVEMLKATGIAFKSATWIAFLVMAVLLVGRCE